VETELEAEGASHAEREDEAAAAAAEVPDFSTAIRKKMFVDGENAITSYAIQDNPDYAHAFRHLPMQKDTAQYRRIVVEGLHGAAVSMRGHLASPPTSPQKVRPDYEGEDAEEGTKREWGEKWGEMVEGLLEMYRPLLELQAAREEKRKQKHIAATKWRQRNPPKPREGQYVISRRMWLHQVNEDIAQERSPDGPPSQRIQPLYVNRSVFPSFSAIFNRKMQKLHFFLCILIRNEGKNVNSLPLTEAWRAHRKGEVGFSPVFSVIFNRNRCLFSCI